MGKVVTIASQKGGVGKTTTALNFSYSLSRLGERVLLIDADPQGGMSIATNIKKKTEKGLIDYLAGQSQLKEIAFYTKNKKMAIMGIGSVDPNSVQKLEAWARKGALSRAVQGFTKYFDYVVIDAPAGLGSLTTALLAASEGVLIVSQCRVLSLKTLPRMLSTINWVQEKSNPDLTLEGIVLSMHNRDNETEQELLKEIRIGFPADLFFSELIYYDPVYETANLRSIPVGMLKAGQQAARNYFQLAIEYKEREMLLDQSKGDEDDLDSGLF